MKKILSLIALTLVLIACGNNLEKVKVGMTEDEVTEIMGKPNGTSSSSSSSTINGEVTSQSNASWTYNGSGSLELENGVVTSVSLD